MNNKALSDLDWAYLAGLIDGEGYIGFNLQMYVYVVELRKHNKLGPIEENA